MEVINCCPDNDHLFIYMRFKIFDLESGFFFHLILMGNKNTKQNQNQLIWKSVHTLVTSEKKAEPRLFDLLQNANIIHLKANNEQTVARSEENQAHFNAM